jgi:hypothetical protein
MSGNWFGFGFLRNIATFAFGIIVIVSALMLYKKPERHVLLGIVIIVFSVLSGGIATLLLGLAGGILAVTWKIPES